MSKGKSGDAGGGEKTRLSVLVSLTCDQAAAAKTSQPYLATS